MSGFDQGMDGNARHQQRLGQLLPSRRYEVLDYLEVYWLFATGCLPQSVGSLEKAW